MISNDDNKKNDEEQRVTRSYIIGGIGVIALLAALVLNWFLDSDTFEKNEAQTANLILPKANSVHKDSQNLKEENAGDIKVSRTKNSESDDLSEKEGVKPKEGPRAQANTLIATKDDLNNDSGREAGVKSDMANGRNLDQPATAIAVSSPKAEIGIKFDVVRISPDGNAVLAGTSGPGDLLEVYDGDTLLGQTESDEQGSWVFVPTAPLSVGQHHIILKKRLSDDEVVVAGTDVLAVTIDPPNQQKKHTKPLAMLLPQEPDKAVTLVQSPLDDSVTQNAVQPSKLEGDVAMDTKEVLAFPLRILQLDISPEGSWSLAGTGTQDARIRYYLDDVFVKDFRIEHSEAAVSQPVPWFLQGITVLSRGITKLRLDVIVPETGKVVQRTQIDLVHEPDIKVAPILAEGQIQPEQHKGKEKKQDLMSSTSVAGMGSEEAGKRQKAQSKNLAEAVKILEQSARMPELRQENLSALRVINIKSGDNLWKIARQTYGEGIAYTYIFSANLEYIKDPDLIFPGQVFVLPMISQDPAR